jgi:uncharacterized protein YlxW (UPF0749 family)
MTGDTRPGGRWSMGASLLDAVLAETLDPAYAQAAAARAERAAADPVAHEATRPRRRWRARGLVALTMAGAGLLVGVTYEQAAATAQGRQQVRAVLAADIQHSSDVADDLAGQLERLRAEVDANQEELLDATAVGQAALDRLARAEQGAGFVPVTGPGLLVTLANAAPGADEDPVGGAPEEDPRGRVRDGDLQQVVNALWASGAEAISINGQRLGPTTAIRFAGEAVLVDFRPVTNPYEISAVGDPDTLGNRFLEDPDVIELAELSAMFGLRFDFAVEDELSLPAASRPQLRSAVSATSETTAPAADPTPGG